MLFKKLKYFISIFLLILLFPLVVSAKDGVVLKVDKNDLTIGDEVVVSVVVPDDLKAYAMIATLNYDENVFYKIDSDNFDSLIDNVEVVFNEENNKFGVIIKSGEIENEIFKIHLKVKDDANVGDTNVTLTNISFSDGDSKIEYEKANAQILVTRDAQEGEAIPNNEQIEYNDTEEKTIKVFNNQPIIIGSFIVSALLLGCLIFIIIKKRDKKVIILTGAALAIFVALTSTLLILNNDKKDINNDGKVDYEDAKEIIEYLIDIKGDKSEDNEDSILDNTLDSNFNNNSNIKPNNKKPSSSATKPSKDKYDTNNDGKVDVNDVGDNVADATEKSSVVLTEYNKDNEYSVNKGEITLKFEAEVTPKGVTVTKVKIDGEDYGVTLNDGIYTVKVKTPDKYGIHNFTITEVLLSNGKTIRTYLTFEREILKDIPSVHHFDVDEHNKTISFDLIDEDEAFISGKVTLYNGLEPEKTFIINNVGPNIIEDLDLIEDNKYNIEIVSTYNIGTDKNDDTYLFENEILYTHSFVLTENYNFTLTDTAITDAIYVGENPIVSFTSTNTKNAIIENGMFTIDDNESKEFVVTKRDGNNYEIELIGAASEPGKHVVKFDSVDLSTLKLFHNDRDYKANSLTYTVLREAPKAIDINLDNDKGNKEIDVDFKLEDQNRAISKLTVALVDSTNKIIATKEVNKEEFLKHLNDNTAIKVSLSYSKGTDGYYTVKVLADYELSDKYKYTNQSIGENNIFTHENDIYINDFYIVNDKNERIDNIYPNKGQKDYKLVIDVNVGDSINQYAVDTYKKGNYQRVSSVTINGLNYPASQISGYRSRVIVNIPEDSGKLELKANRVSLAINQYYLEVNDFYSVIPKTVVVDVLKDKPTIKDLSIIEEDYDEGSVTFRFYVQDDKGGFESGTVSLDNQTQNIQYGENTVTFTGITKDENLDLIFKGNYDLDTDSSNGKNYYQDTEFYRITYGLYSKEVYDKLNITNVKTNSDNNDNYYEKNEKIDFSFELLENNNDFVVDSIVISGKEYKVTKDNETYHTLVDGYTISGVKNLVVTDLLLNNGKKVTLSEPVKARIEVLKDYVKVTDYKYEFIDNKIKLTFALDDFEKAIVGSAKVQVLNDQGVTIIDQDYTDEVTFDTDSDIVRYYVKVVATYDRDNNDLADSENHYNDVILLDKVISLDKNNIEFRNIEDISLYKKEYIEGEEVISLKDEVDVLDIKNNKDSYFIEIVMKDLPTARARIKDVVTTDDILTLVLEYEYATRENTNKAQTIRVDFGAIKNGKAINEYHPADAFKTLLDKLEQGESVTLTRDYDASSLNVDANTYVTKDYSGTLNGNGYTIRNLSKPLFNKIVNGTVENLLLENVELNNNGRGSLANETNGATINNIIVNNVVKTAASGGQNGGLIGLAKAKSTISHSGVKNVTLYGGSGSANQQNGGLIGCLEDSSADNNYVIGVITSSYNYAGGFVGNAIRSKMTNNIAKVNINGSNQYFCTFACTYQGPSSYINNISLSTSNLQFVNNSSLLENNYYLTNSTDEKNGINNISKEQVNSDLFSKAQFDNTIWRMDNISYDNLPIFKTEKTSIFEDFDSEDYEPNKEILYKNLMKLAPFYDNDKIIKMGKNINDGLLIEQEIANIVPVDAYGNLVTYLTSDNVGKITKLKVVFKNKEKREYTVTYDKNYDMVATYRINELNIDYNYNHYVINMNSQVVNNLTNYLESLDYTENLDMLTTNADSRIYRDFYNEVTKKELKEFVLKVLSNSNYTNTSNDEDINNYIERELKKDHQIEKMLYTYNYFRRFYDLDIEGIKLYDFMMFNMQGFDSSLTPSRITSLYFKDPTGVSFNTNATNTSYNSLLGGYTKLDTIPKLLEYVVTSFSNYKMDEWTRSQFKGILVEISIDNHPEIKYTLWDHFSYEGSGYNVYNHVLPILTLPKDSTYIISAPAQYIIGSQRTYMSNPSDINQVEEFKAKMETYTTRMKSYYSTVYSILEDKDLFNNINLYQIDKRNTKDENGASVYNVPNMTEEPFHKNFNEVVGIWTAQAGNNAVAWGDRIEWMVAGVLDSTLATDGTNDVGHVTYKTFTHESAHNLDGRLFLKNYGRRFDAGGEDYADSFLMQSFGINDIVMNFSINFNDNYEVGSNLKPERINSPEEVHDFYKKAFDTIYIMDYLEARAFLQLSAEDQAEVAVQASYPDEEKYKNDDSKIYLAYKVTRYDEKTTEDFANMKLETVADLYDNKIMLYPGIYKNASKGDNLYGGEGLNVVHWYQPHNDYGRPDSYSLKWISYEMLGYAGYDKGFVEYASNRNSITAHGKNNFKSDLMALKTITNNQYNSFDEYKKARFKYVEDNLDKINKEIDVNYYVQKFYDALVEDGDNMKAEVEKTIQTGTAAKTEQACIDNYWCVRALASAKGLPKSTAVRQEIYYKLKNSSNDFVDSNIYFSTKQQEVGDLKVNKNN